MQTAIQVPSPIPGSEGEKVYLQIPIPDLSTHCDGRKIFHFRVIALADQIRQYLASALSTKSYLLSDDAEYVDGVLRFEIASSPNNMQMDLMEAQRVYAAASQDVEHALSYLDDPVGAVTEGLEIGRTKSEFHALFKAATPLVKENQLSPIEAAVVHGTDEVRVNGTIAPASVQREAKRRLSPPANYQLEKLTVTFVAQDSDGVLVSDQDELFDPGDANRDRYPLGEPVAVEAQVEKTRVIRDARKITRPLDEDEEPDKQ